MFYKVVTQVALILILAASLWQSARQENIVPPVLSDSYPDRSFAINRDPVPGMYRGGISYSQSEKFTVFLGNEGCAGEGKRGSEKGTKTIGSANVPVPGIFFGVVYNGCVYYSLGRELGSIENLSL